MYGNMPEGPKAIALDSDGNIYIADNANQRISKYGPEGNFSSSISLPNGVAPWDLAIDVRGNIYVLDRITSNVLKFDPDGVLIRTYSAPRGMDAEALRFLPDGTLAIQGTNAQVSRLGTPEREFTPEEKGATEAGFLYRDGIFKPGIFHRSPDGRWGILVTTLAGGKALTLTVSLPEAILGPISPSGPEKPGGGEVGFHDVDAQGNYYVDVAIVHSGVRLKVDAWILRYDVAGSLTAFLPLRPPVLYTYPSAFASFRIAPNGDVYVLQPFKDQVKVIRWEYRP
jgi:hypothetical protein